MRYEIFDQWLNKQKQIATIHVLGFPINGELVKRMLFALTSVISILFYVGRSLINPNDMFQKVQDVQKKKGRKKEMVCMRVCLYFLKRKVLQHLLFFFFFLDDTQNKKKF